MAPPVIIIIIHILFMIRVSTETAPLAPALYVFGDSLFDVGNNNLLSTLSKANYHPYGVDFVKGPTGRFTNGRTLPDFIAEYLGVPYPPPIIRLTKPDSYEGFNYASGSCGILDESGNHLVCFERLTALTLDFIEHYQGKCLNLKDQINLFKGTVEDVLKKRYKNPIELSNHLSKSIFIFSTGNNDYLGNYFNPAYATAKRYTPQQFSKLLLLRLSTHLTRLYTIGARKVVFFELGPIGCIPAKTRTTKHSGQCNEEINGIISMFNDGLGPLLSHLTSTLEGSHFILGRVNGLGYDAVINPSKYGLTNTKNSCCKAWLNNTTSCIPEVRPCEDHNSYYFWDAYHLTEAMASIVSSRCINDPSLCFPLSIQQLVLL